MRAGAFATPRARLRLLEPADEALYCALYTHAAVMAHIGAPRSPDVARGEFLAACRRNAGPAPGELRWAVRDARAGCGLGLLAVIRAGTAAAGAEIGIMLLPGAQGRGLGRELVEAVAARAFGPGGAGLERLWARHAPGNAAAQAMLSASGFAPGPPLGAAATMVLQRQRWNARTG